MVKPASLWRGLRRRHQHAPSCLAKPQFFTRQRAEVWRAAHAWTNGQVELLNRTIKEAVMQRCHDESTAQLSEQLPTLLLAYNHAKRLKRLRKLPSHEFVCAQPNCLHS